jgi:hypothetical protein
MLGGGNILRLFVFHIALALLVERDADAVAHQLVAQRAAHSRNREGEADMLDRAVVPRLDDMLHQFHHPFGGRFIGDELVPDLLGRLFAVAGARRQVHQPAIILAYRLRFGEDERDLHHAAFRHSIGLFVVGARFPAGYS